MRYYLIDELSNKDLEKTERFLRENAVQSNIEKLYWVEIPEECLDGTQTQHRDCHPYFFSIELGVDWIKAEFFIRTLNKLNCSCSGYCDHAQRKFISNYIEELVSKLGIRT